MPSSAWNRAIRSLQHLPEPVQEQLLGPQRDGEQGLVADVLGDVLRNLQRAARTPFQQPERREALLRTLACALGEALQRWRPSTPAPVELERLRDWFRERFVSEQFLVLLTPRGDSRLDVTRLCEELDASELAPEQLGLADGDAWLRLLVAGFYRGVAAEACLQSVIPLQQQALYQAAQDALGQVGLSSGLL